MITDRATLAKGHAIYGHTGDGWYTTQKYTKDSYSK